MHKFPNSRPVISPLLYACSSRLQPAEFKLILKENVEGSEAL